jgi:hypothetical protein
MRKPPINLKYIHKLTDDVGMIQHAKFSTPIRKQGYTTDDNARALIAYTNYLNVFGDTKIVRLLDIYLSFLLYMQREDGRMHNFLTYDRKFSDEVGSDDCMGRTIWACGFYLASNLSADTKLVAKEIFDKTMIWASNLSSPRSKAFAIMGLYYYHKEYPSDQNPKLNCKMLADQLVKQFELQSSEEWKWFESLLTYANAQLSRSLLLAYRLTGEARYKQVALESLEFLLSTQTIEETFVPIGNRGWYKRGFERAIYDQQPIEAACTIEASVAAYEETGKALFRNSALNAFEWFLGKNTKKVKVYNPKTGSCCDGIMPQGLNVNKGAEANIAYLHSRVILESQL